MKFHFVILVVSCALLICHAYCNIIPGGPIKTAHFLRYHIFAATTDILVRFLLKCSEITAENNKRKFFKQVLNILCKVTVTALRHTRLLDDDQPAVG